MPDRHCEVRARGGTERGNRPRVMRDQILRRVAGVPDAFQKAGLVLNHVVVFFEQDAFDLDIGADEDFFQWDDGCCGDVFIGLRVHDNGKVPRLDEPIEP